MLKEEFSQRSAVKLYPAVFPGNPKGIAPKGIAIERTILSNASRRADDADKDGDTARPRVLIVDDEQVIANTLAAILNHSGFEACAVYSGEAAVDALTSFEPDMVISDVVMPGMTGIETAIAIRSKRPDCKILLFSGQATTTDLMRCARAKGHSFEILSKPVHPTELLAKLRNHLTHSF